MGSDMIGTMKSVVIVESSCAVYSGLIHVAYLHCHTFYIVHQLEDSSPGLFRSGLIGPFTINWFMVKTFHLQTILPKTWNITESP